MANPSAPTISFDVLIRGATDDVSVASASLDKLRPSPESIEKCHRWLSEQGVTSHKTSFGLACECDVELFRSLFSVEVSTETTGDSTSPAFQLRGEPTPPTAIADLVSQITVAPPPTFF